MGLPGKCYYVPGQVGEQARSLAGAVQEFWRSGWEPLVRGGIDGYNISEFLIDKRCGLEWDYAAYGQTGPKKLCAPALSETQVPALRRKGEAGNTRKYGLELVVDPTGPGATYGRVCVVASTDTTKQIGSLIPEDPAGTSTPALDFRANYGPLRMRGATTLILQTTGGTARFTINSDDTVTQAGAQTFTGTLTATADALLGNARLNSTTQAASDAGNYNVAATVGTVFVNGAALTTNFDVTLPSAATYENRIVVVKITTVGGGGSTVTVKSASGTVEGAAAATGVALDATARSRVAYQSDGTNWWSVLS